MKSQALVAVVAAFAAGAVSAQVTLYSQETFLRTLVLGRPDNA
jgi:hypothetical protein